MKKIAYIDNDAEDVISYYCALTRDELKTMVINGDDTACAFYVQKCEDDGVLSSADVKYLDGAIENGDIYAASYGMYLFGVKGGMYENEDKRLFCCAVLEQHGSIDGHKTLKKAYKSHVTLIDKYDNKILTTSIAKVATSASFSRLDGLIFRLTPPAKNDTLDHKTAQTLNCATVKNGVRSAYESIYTSYCRDKYPERTTARLIEAIKDYFADKAEKLGLKVIDVYEFTKLVYHYGDTEAKKHDTATVSETSDADINVVVSDERLHADASICPACGGQIVNGVCSACGKTYEKSDIERGKIVIQRAKNMEALLCTQCHAPVTLDAGGKSAVCPYCGTTFIVNGNALTSGVGGLDFASIKSDMPENAELPEVKFIRADIMNDRISAVLPDSFKVMSEEHRKIKYPVNPPEYIYTTPDTCVNLCLSANGSPLEDKDVPIFGRQILTALKNLRKDALFGEAKELTADGGKHVFFIDFITQGLDQSIYNAMFFFAIGGRQATGSWNCLGKDRWYWAQIFEHAIKTMHFN